MSTPTDEPLLTIEQVCRLLGGITDQTAKKFLGDCLIRIGRRVFVHPADVRAFIERKKAEAKREMNRNANGQAREDPAAAGCVPRRSNGAQS